MFYISGSINVHQCSIEKNIPIYMIVAGLFTMIKLLLNIYIQTNRLLKKEVPEITKSLVVKIVNGILDLFLVVWFIAGTLNFFSLVIFII